MGMVGARVPLSLTSLIVLSSDPQGPLRCQRERALQKEVDEAEWKIENSRELVNVRKGWWETQG